MPPSPSPPSVTPCPRKVECGLQRKMLGLRGLVSHLQGIIKCLQRQHLSSRHIIQPVGFIHQMKVQVTLCLHDQAFTYQRPTNKNKYAFQGSTSHNIMPSKPYIIKEPPEHVHQIPPFQNKHMLKDLIQFTKFRYGKGVIVPYWVDHFSGQEVFPKWNRFSKSCSGYEVDGVRLLGMRLHNMQGFILSHLWVSLQRVCCPSSAMQHFSKPICH